MTNFEGLRQEVLALHEQYTNLLISHLRLLGVSNTVLSPQSLAREGSELQEQSATSVETRSELVLPTIEQIERAESLFSSKRRRVVWTPEEEEQIRRSVRLGLTAVEIAGSIQGKEYTQIASKIKRIRRELRGEQ